MEDLTNSNSATTVGILHCGEMGSAFGKLLRKGGLQVITSCQGRTRATEERARSAGIEILSTVSDVAARSQFVFSFVLPSAAVDVARQYASWHQIRPKESIFVEANSIGVEKLEQIEHLMAERNISLVDAAVNGMASRLEDHGVLHISGPKAGSVEAICRDLMRVNSLGAEVGLASRMKLLMSGIAKGLPALFLEVAILAERANLLESFLQSCRLFYPSIMTVVERTLPTFPRHAARRVSEMADVEQMAEALHSRAGMTHEAAEWIQLMASLPWDRLESQSAADLRTVIQSVAKSCPSETPSRRFLEVLK